MATQFVKQFTITSLPQTITFSSISVGPFTTAPKIILQSLSDRPLHPSAITTTQFTVDALGVGDDDPPFDAVGIFAPEDTTTTPAVAGLSYQVSEILEDIAHRIGPEKFAQYGELFILRAMNRAYARINFETMIVRRETTIDFTTYTSSTLKDYVALPADFVKAYHLDPHKDWRAPAAWRKDEDRTYTIDVIDSEKRFYAADAATDLQITMRYFSRGNKLVNKSSLATGEANQPEWPDELLHLIYYETLLAIPHELTPAELSAAQALQSRMSGYQVGPYLQVGSANLAGEQARNSFINDPYSTNN